MNPMGADDANARDRAWATYWRSGALASCQGAMQDSYGGRLRQWWRAFFADLPDGARVLDIGTGNGAVLHIAAELARERDRRFELHGIDSAAIEPLAALGERGALLGEATFHARTGAERTGFGDASFDAITGQYALEYSATEHSVPELARVARPGARIAFVLHREDSVVAARMRQQLEQIALLFERTELLTAARCLFHAVDTPREGQHRSEFQEAAAQVVAAARASDNPALLEQTLHSLAEAYERRRGLGREGLIQWLQGLTEDLEATATRLRDLSRARLSAEGVESLVADCGEAGFVDVTYGSMAEEDGTSLGWTLTARMR